MADDFKKASPAYVAYATFKSTIRSLPHNGQLPHRIDTSVLTTMSGSSQNQFLGAMKFFDLIDEKGAPSTRLKALATGEENVWNAEMKKLVLEHYSDQVKHLEAGTPHSLRESFGDIGGIVKPAVRFLLAACKDTGIPVSPHIARDKSSVAAPPRKRKPSVKGVESFADTHRPAVTQPAAPAPKDFRSVLLDKFPAFDPNWNEEQQNNWFSAYSKLIGMQDSGEKKAT